jgi:hypothetical protein
MSSWRQEDMFAYLFRCVVSRSFWLVMGFVRRSSLFKSRFILSSLLTTAYSGLLSEYEMVISED